MLQYINRYRRHRANMCYRFRWWPSKSHSTEIRDILGSTTGIAIRRIRELPASKNIAYGVRVRWKRLCRKKISVLDRIADGAGITMSPLCGKITRNHALIDIAPVIRADWSMSEKIRRKHFEIWWGLYVFCIVSYMFLKYFYMFTKFSLLQISRHRIDNTRWNHWYTNFEVITSHRCQGESRISKILWIHEQVAFVITINCITSQWYLL